VASPDAVFAVREGISLPAWHAALTKARGRMLAARAARPRPRRDDKVLTAWNGLMISAYAVAHRATGKPEYLTTARKAARFALDHLRDREGHPLVSWHDGTPGGPGFIDDSAFLIRGLLDLQAADHDPAWLDAADRLARDAARFADPAGGWFFATDRKDLIARPLVLNDQALPSGNAVMVENLARISRLTGDLGSLSAARRAVDRAATVMRTSPASYPYMILARDTLDAAVAAASRPAATGELATAAAAAAPARAPAAATTAPAAGAPTPPPAPAAASAANRPPDGAPRSIPGVLVGRGSKERVVDAQLQQPAGATRPGGTIEIPVLLDIHQGWHVNSSKPTLDYLIPTRLLFTPGETFTVDGIDYPDGAMVKLQFAEEPLSVYQGRVTLRARLRVDPKTPAGSIDAVARLSYQACSEKACLAPETVEFRAALAVAGEPIASAPTEVTTPAAPSAAPAPTAPSAGDAAAGAPSATRIEGQDQLSGLLRQRGLLFVMGVVFLGGLALTLTPCVYPMIPVTLGFFSQQASDAGWGRRVALPALYVLGMALTYSVLGVIAGSTGGLFGAALQSPILVGAMILLFVAMALWMFGVFELSLPGALTRLGTGRAGALGALLMGLTLGLVAAPCIGPFIVTLLAFVGASGSAWLGFLLFFVLALGMGLPFLVLGTFSGMLATLPRSGVWLIYAKKVMGVGLLGVALYFMQPFLADHVLGWSAIVFAVAAGLYLAWLEKTRMRAAWFLPLRFVIGALVVTGGFWLALPLVRAREQPRWQPYTDEAVTRAQSDGRPVIIDFFAVWCAPCRELDRSTYSDPGVLGELGRFTLLKADLTNAESPAVQTLRDRYAVYGVPTVVLLDRQGKDRKDLRLTGFEPAGPFLERLRRIP
jgi:thiol:disulfide interchange protein DsbD